MGFREWVFIVENNKDIRTVLKIIDKHNHLSDDSERGEFVEIGSIAKCKNKKYPTYYFLNVATGGGGQAVSDFVYARYPHHKIIGPFETIPHRKTNVYTQIPQKRNKYLISPFNGHKIKYSNIEPELSDVESSYDDSN